jgi:hypothetical protein
MKRESPLTLHYKLLGKHHVPDIVGTSGAAAASFMSRNEIVAALRDICTILDEKKAQFELMIEALENEEVAAEAENPDTKEEDVACKRESPLTLHCRIFEGIYVSDIVATSGQKTSNTMI